MEVVSEHEEPIIFDTIGEGRFFGEISVVFSCPRTASIRLGHMGIYAELMGVFIHPQYDFPWFSGTRWEGHAAFNLTYCFHSDVHGPKVVRTKHDANSNVLYQWVFVMDETFFRPVNAASVANSYQYDWCRRCEILYRCLWTKQRRKENELGTAWKSYCGRYHVTNILISLRFEIAIGTFKFEYERGIECDFQNLKSVTSLELFIFSVAYQQKGRL